MLPRPPFIRSNPISHSLPPVKLPSFFLLAFPFSPLLLPSPILFSYFPLPSPPPFLIIPILLSNFPPSSYPSSDSLRFSTPPLVLFSTFIAKK